MECGLCLCHQREENKSLNLACKFFGNVEVGIFYEINALIHSYIFLNVNIFILQLQAHPR